MISVRESENKPKKFNGQRKPSTRPIGSYLPSVNITWMVKNIRLTTWNCVLSLCWNQHLYITIFLYILPCTSVLCHNRIGGIYELTLFSCLLGFIWFSCLMSVIRICVLLSWPWTVSLHPLLPPISNTVFSVLLAISSFINHVKLKFCLFTCFWPVEFVSVF